VENLWTSATGAWLHTAAVMAWAEALTEGQRRRLDELRALGRHVIDAEVDDERDRRWHDLLFAVGNMKRSAGNIHPPGTWLRASPSQRDAPTSVLLPYGSESKGGGIVSRDEPDSWLSLQQHVHGLGAATTSMVLASLWPSYHATLDRLTRLMLGALTWECSADGNKPHPPKVSLPAYRDWYRPQVRGIAIGLGADLWVIERGLFCFAQRVFVGRKPQLRWQDDLGWPGFGQQVSRLLERGPTDQFSAPGVHR
jgi:hypothetical protein